MTTATVRRPFEAYLDGDTTATKYATGDQFPLDRVGAKHYKHLVDDGFLPKPERVDPGQAVGPITTEPLVLNDEPPTRGRGGGRKSAGKPPVDKTPLTETPVETPELTQDELAAVMAASITGEDMDDVGDLNAVTEDEVEVVDLGNNIRDAGISHETANVTEVTPLEAPASEMKPADAGNTSGLEEPIEAPVKLTPQTANLENIISDPIDIDTDGDLNKALRDADKPAGDDDLGGKVIVA